jgi:DNA-binding CsgD family transcriptional regulator
MVDFVGRRSERERLDVVIAKALAGESGALVVRGEAGIGKSALLEYGRASAEAAGYRTLSALGVEEEAQLAYAGLHQLCSPLLEGVAALPAPQLAALGIVFGTEVGDAPDQFLIGLAVLNLLAEAAEDQPVLCVVDDFQWLDQASAEVLTFVARRIQAERVAMFVGLRDQTAGGRLLSAVPDLHLAGLSAEESQTLLSAAVRIPMDGVVRDRIVDEARGNPLALLELPFSVHPMDLAGGFDIAHRGSTSRLIETSVRTRLRALPDAARSFMLLAAADPTGDTALVLRAAETLGISLGDSEPAEAAGFLTITSRVRFSHPLIRSVVYRSASAVHKRAAHRALAEATDRQSDPDRRAWHRALAVVGTDADASRDLEVSAERARSRGGFAAAAAFLKKAAALSPTPGERARLSLEASSLLHEAGDSEAARELLSLADTAELSALSQARAKALRAQIAYTFAEADDAPALLLDAARLLSPLDAALARDTYLDALDAATLLSAGETEHRVFEIAVAAGELAPPASHPPRAADQLLDGLVRVFTRGYAAGIPSLRAALSELERTSSSHATPQEREHARRWLWLASRTSVGLFEDVLVYTFAERSVDMARRAGALSMLPAALLHLCGTLLHYGELARAGELAAESTAISQAIGVIPIDNAQLMLAAWRGDLGESEELYAANVGRARERGEGTAVSLADYAHSVLHNSLGNYTAAFEAADRASRSQELLQSNLSLPELIEAASRSGNLRRAREALDELIGRTDASATRWARGLAARSRALVAEGERAEELYLAAIEHLSQTKAATHLARAQLVYGEWLRREGRRQDAREVLRVAHESFDDMGARAFATRTAGELQATGANPRKRSAQLTDDLTPQEVHIARVVATGATSKEVGAQLFLSPRTVEAHLRSIFRKLHITSRRQLRDILLP